MLFSGGGDKFEKKKIKIKEQLEEKEKKTNKDEKQIGKKVFLND